MQPQYVLLKDTDVLIGKWMVEDVLNVNMDLEKKEDFAIDASIQLPVIMIAHKIAV